MLKYYFILAIVFTPFSLMAQRNCVDFENYELSQNWIRELNKLDVNTKKDYILNRIKCERFFKNLNDDYDYSLIYVFNGLTNMVFPEYRDTLFSQIRAQNMILLNSLCEGNMYLQKCNLGILIIDKLDKPIIDSIDVLTIQKIERKTKIYKKQRTIKESKILIKLKCAKSQEFILRIEDFYNKDNNRTEKLFLKKGKRIIGFSVDNEVKVISIIDSEKNLITIIN